MVMNHTYCAIILIVHSGSCKETVNAGRGWPGVQQAVVGVKMEYCLCLSGLSRTTSNDSLEMLDSFESDNFTALLEELAGMRRVWSWKHAVQALKFTFSVGAIIMNSLSVLAIVVSRCTMSANARLVTSLALSDLLCGVCGFLDDASVASIVSCSRRASKCLVVIAHFSALLTILCLAVDHYLAVSKPLYHRSDDNIARVSVVIALIWFFSCTGSLVDVFAEVHNPLICYHINQATETRSTCDCEIKTIALARFAASCSMISTLHRPI